MTSVVHRDFEFGAIHQFGTASGVRNKAQGLLNGGRLRARQNRVHDAPLRTLRTHGIGGLGRAGQQMRLASATAEVTLTFIA